MWFVIIEAIYMSYFTVEFVVRLITCPSKSKFLKKSMNWIDLLAIVPYFVTISLNTYGVTEDGMPGVEEEVPPAGHCTNTLSLIPSVISTQVHSVLALFRNGSAYMWHFPSLLALAFGLYFWPLLLSLTLVPL
jgi:hypothetical protein